MTTCDTTTKSNTSPASKPHDSHPSRQSKLPWDNMTLRRLQLQDSRWQNIIYEKEKCNNRKFQNYKIINGVLFWSHSISDTKNCKLCVPNKIVIGVIKFISNFVNDLNVENLFNKMKNFFIWKEMKKHIIQILK